MEVINADRLPKSAHLLPDKSLETFDGFYWNWKPVKFRWKHFKDNKIFLSGMEKDNDKIETLALIEKMNTTAS